MSSETASYIAVVSDLEAFESGLKEEHAGARIKCFFKDDFLVEDAKAVIKEAYVAESSIKTIALGAKSFNLYAQNSLLKILEEPPHNTAFILAVHSKTSLLPTIRSRLPIRVFQEERILEASGLNFQTLGLGDIYAFTQERKFLERQALKSLLQVITKEAIAQGVPLKAKDLTLFAALVQLADLNSRAHNCLMTQLLTIYQRMHP